MKTDLIQYVTERTNELINAFSCCPEAKAAAQRWLKAVGTETQGEETGKFLAELEADLVAIDDLIALAESDLGARIFGADHAKEVAAHGKEIKAAGAKYCDCPACAAACDILEQKDALLKL